MVSLDEETSPDVEILTEVESNVGPVPIDTDDKPISNSIPSGKYSEV